MTALFIFSICVVITTFICSMAEAAILSLPHAYVLVLKQRGARVAKLLEKQKANIDETLAGILTLNTIGNTLGGAAVGAKVLEMYGSHTAAIASASLGFVLLVGAEIVPKAIGATYCREVAPFAAYIIFSFNYVAYPFVVFSSSFSKFMNKRAKKRLVTREEMIVTAEMGATDGVIHAKESRVIKNLLGLDKLQVRDIMTPRALMLTYQKDMTISHVVQKEKQIRFSRIPVFNRDQDDIVGMILRYEILNASSKDQDDVRLEELMSPIRSISQATSVAHVLDEFIRHKEHVFVVVDDYGATVGLVTLEDAIETLLGVEIVDEFDTEADLRKFAIEQWEKRRKWMLKSASQKIQR